MKKLPYLLLALTTVTLTGCFASVLGSAIQLGFKMGVYSILLLFILLCWVIINRGKRK